MPKNADLKKIFVIGSGPVLIGQGCEFDYSGTQACKALLEEGCEVVLLNSNPATVMTDHDMANVTYIAPMTVEVCEEIIKKHRPDALLATLGGQTALNLSLELDRRGILNRWNVRLIGASVKSIEKAENRKFFREAMQKIGLETPAAYTVTNLMDVMKIKDNLIFPLIIRTSFSLGGLGSGIVYNFDELFHLCQLQFSDSKFSTLEIENSVLGWKEFEMEAIRDQADNCIIVCSLENIDPMGIHTGDSMTVAPAQTLCNKEYQRMRNATFAVLREIGVNTGGANVQFAVHPKTGQMLVIEMNPRVSRSSALASKATGYPIAKIATKLALGYTLDELTNITMDGMMPASFEPMIDYVVTKLPRFDFEKFPRCTGNLITKMQSTGEVIGIGRNFQESLQKAICSLDKDYFGLKTNKYQQNCIEEKLSNAHYERIFYIAEAFRRGLTSTEISEKTAIDCWFLDQIQELVDLELRATKKSFIEMPEEELRLLKRKGFSDKYLAELFEVNEQEVRCQRQLFDIFPVYKRVDSCAAEFSVETVCLYSTYDQECESQTSCHKKILIIGSGPNRIGQGIEFDYSSVHAALTCRENGYETIMINSNPETVSTDYDIVDRLYIEPLTLEHVLNVIEIEKPDGVMVQFGGQTALSLASELDVLNIPLLGTSAGMIDQCENRNIFRDALMQLGLRQPDNFCIQYEDVWRLHEKVLRYPVIIRPSYLLSGSSMQIIHDSSTFINCMEVLSKDPKYFPVLVECFLENVIEIEVDGVCDGHSVFIPSIMEQLEPAGIHSGDSSCCLPPHTISTVLQQVIMEQASQLALAFNIIGLFNIQFAVQKDQVFVLELNPRASRTIPFISKALGVSLPRIAVLCMLGHSLRKQGYIQPLVPTWYSIKAPVFPFDRLHERSLGPQMCSTGEIMFVKQDVSSLLVDTVHTIGFDLCSLQELHHTLQSAPF